MQVVLVMFRGDGERRSFSVVRNMTIIGRREDCDLRIPVGDVSRKHCRLMTGDDEVTIEDLGSSNGTFVNYQRVQSSALSAGDVIGVGPVMFTVQINGVPDEDEMTPPAAQVAAVDPDDSSAGYQAPTILDETPHEDEGLVEEAPTLGEAATVDEEPVEELAEVEEPLEELPEDELLEADEEPLEAVDELEEAPEVDEAEDTLEPLDAIGKETAAEEELEEALLDAEDEEPESLDELEFDEAPKAATKPILEDELEELPMPPAAAKEEIEELSLDEEAPAPSAPHAAKHGDSAEGSAWDFVIEETETEHSPHELHIDLDAPHQQPHQ